MSTPRQPDQHLTVTLTAPASLTREQIGARLSKIGLTISGVKFHTFGRPHLSISPDQVRKLRAEGLSLRDIAVRVGCNHVTVANILAAGGE
jgi:sugar phosphate isomerase/epimerase